MQQSNQLTIPLPTSKLKIKLKDKIIPKFKIKLKGDYILANKKNYSLAEEFPMRKPPVISKDYNLMSPVEKGDIIVRYIHDYLSSSDVISDMVNTSGISNHIFDIIVRIKKDNSLRGLQIKTLTRMKDNLWYATVDSCQYPDDTLIIFANFEQTRFGLFFWKDVSKYKKSFYLDFSENDTRHKNIKFTNINLFKERLYDLIQISHVVNNIQDGILSNHYKKEYSSIRNIKRLCEKNNIKFEYNYTNGNHIDIYLNGHPCQCKSTNNIHYKLYQCGLHKKINSIRVPYDECDGIDYFIFQILSLDDNPIYNDDILIIPNQVLIEKGYIRTKNQNGLNNFTFSSPDFAGYYWTIPFWNNFGIIQNHLQSISNPIYNFSKKYKCIIRNISINKRNIYSTDISRSNRDENFEYLAIFLNDKSHWIYEDYLFLISKMDLIKLNYMPKNLQKCSSLYIKPPDYRERHWSSSYWVNINDLDKI